MPHGDDPPHKLGRVARSQQQLVPEFELWGGRGKAWHVDGAGRAGIATLRAQQKVRIRE